MDEFSTEMIHANICKPISQLGVAIDRSLLNYSTGQNAWASTVNGGSALSWGQLGSQ